MPVTENLSGTTKKPYRYHLAPTRIRLKSLSSLQALRKKHLFSGIYKSDKFTVDAAYNAFADVTSTK